MIKRILLLLALAWLSACSQKSLAPESQLDSPELHVRQALRLIDQGQLPMAEEELNRALALDKRFVDAICAKALLKLEQGNPEEAEELSRKAVSLADNRWVVWQTKARVQSSLKKKNWVEGSLKSFARGLKLAKADANATEELYYYRGLTKIEAFQFNEAVDDLARVAGSRGDFGARADAALDKVQKIVRARPGSEASSKVALLDHIDRGELAVLLVEELKLPDLLTKNRRSQSSGFQAPEQEQKLQSIQEPADIKTHWARSWINQLISSGGMQLFPGGQFQPNESVSRAEYAQILVTILADISRDEGLHTRYFGEQSKFPDMSSSHPAYNAAAVVSTRGIMKADLISGEFHPMDTISGAEALLVIRQLQNELRLSYR